MNHPASTIPADEGIDQAILRQWNDQHKDPKALTEELSATGWEAGTITEYLKAYRRLRDRKKQFRAFVFLALGAILGLVSCLLAIIDPVPAWHDLFLYGLMSLSILIVFAGLYLLFE